MPNAAIYVGADVKSTEGDTVDAQSQIVECRGRAADMGYSISDDAIHIENVKDQGLRIVELPALKNLRSQIYKKTIDLVLCYSPETTASESLGLLLIWSELKNNQVRLEFVHGPNLNEERGWDLQYAVWQMEGPAQPPIVKEIVAWEPPDGDHVEGIVFRTDQTDIYAIFHEVENASDAILWIGGARGGLNGAGGFFYPKMAELVKQMGISSLRLDYRRPGIVDSSSQDCVMGIEFLKQKGISKVVVVGHSFGGAVAIQTGIISDVVAGVVALASQTDGAEDVANLSPTPLLIVHGDGDTHLPLPLAFQIYAWAEQPKELVVLEGAGHGLTEKIDDLEQLLLKWIPRNLDL